jgi:hypothetical protein
MLQRKICAESPKLLPNEWIQSVGEVLNQTYKEQCEAQNKRFDIFGQIYTEELFVVAGFAHAQDPYEASISLFLSCDAHDMNTAQKVKETQAGFVDLMGLFFDEIFSTPDWSEWEPNWQEVEWKDKKFFYKLTRENVSLTLEADRILQAAGFSSDDDE